MPRRPTASLAVKADTQITASARRASAAAAATGTDSSSNFQATTSWRVMTSAYGDGGSSRFILCTTACRG